jgi:serine acetyltransferase
LKIGKGVVIAAGPVVARNVLEGVTVLKILQKKIIDIIIIKRSIKGDDKIEMFNM